ncbi:hypothetical protein [Hyphococcus sp.]|uniref:hypothetical protein n=1 Tax=Hyphococcus sp. TaxID=2038636 RepID=UPI003CCBB37E
MKKSGYMAAISLAGFCLFSGGVSAQPPGCNDIPGARDFDFWLGTWEVYDKNEKLGGVNKISKRSGGCLILEEWRSANGGEGVSMNFLDPRTGNWTQTWMGTNNYITYEGGLNADGQMVLTGQITYFSAKGARSADFKGTWTPNNDGSVTQHFEEFDADAGVWNDWFVGTYKRVDDDLSTEE